ncbi:phosphoglycerate mutase [Stylonychia lemnae]|uniref:Phosphoglycerate mutase n=1 Tax=Stylonychia lemnae TaxID=5949 RepID=A0A077ZNC6_STYLE|nr:phosphoglycerate mutase [Stylonychia lemnae]|eukprot:CDW71482.1 phosphoglycerate mutase [Stylonychia lemnae]
MKNIDLRQLEIKLSSFLQTSTQAQKRLVLVRSAESQGNLSGTITGWMDVRLSDFGRKQAFTLNSVLSKYQDHFRTIHSSDLQRCSDTAFYALGFPSDEEIIKQVSALRELNFGAHEGLHYDGLSQEEKQKLSDPLYQAPQGESWPQVKERAARYFGQLNTGNHLIFTHGGVITSYLYDQGITEMPNNCSVLGLTLAEQNQKDLAELKQLDFVWNFPHLDEDI